MNVYQWLSYILILNVQKFCNSDTPISHHKIKLLNSTISASTSGENLTMKNVLVVAANGSEDIEVVTPVDVLRRAGANVTLASVDGSIVKLSNDISIVTDCVISKCEHTEYDLVVIPGGMPGAEHCRDSKELQKILLAQKQGKRLIAAICASPAVVLESFGILEGITAVAYPSFMKMLKNPGSGRVVVSSNIVTSIGPGSAMEFSMKLVELLYGIEKRLSLEKSMCVT